MIQNIVVEKGWCKEHCKKRTDRVNTGSYICTDLCSCMKFRIKNKMFCFGKPNPKKEG